MIIGNASYSKRIQKTVIQRKLQLYLDTSEKHIYICDSHKSKIQCARTNNKRRKDSSAEDTDNALDTEVDFFSLQVSIFDI